MIQGNDAVDAGERRGNIDSIGNVLKIAGVVALVVAAAIFSKMSCDRVTENSGYKPSRPMTAEENRALIQRQIAGVEANPNLSPEGKAMTIGMIKAHAGDFDKKASPAPASPQ